MRERLLPTAYQMREGGSVADAMRSSGMIDEVVLDMVETGESTGNLDQMLSKVSEYYEDEAKVRARQAAIVGGMVLMGLVAIYVGYVVISFWGGYYGGMMRELSE
jgi:type II secretory pathway component PulF